ncbi:hypothetical protein thsps117_29030 [Pseudomonas sp. No.117]
MITSIILRNFKTYQNINYIPLSNGKLFSALVGENGVGKSSVLEALDCFFNNREWSINHSISKGYSGREPYICPIFLIEKSKLGKFTEGWLIELLSDTCWNSQIQDFNPSVRPHIESFCLHREALVKEGFCAETHFLFPLGLEKENKHTTPKLFLSIFEQNPTVLKATKYLTYEKASKELQEKILNHFNYIYLPSDIDFKEYTKIESITVQALLGQKIDAIVRELIKKSDVQKINKKLNEFLNGISETLESYVYKKPTTKQNLVTQSHLTTKVIEAYFESKVLNKKTGKETVPVSDLSSGEKRQALIDLARSFLINSTSETTKETILAIDEPELSLHVSACFEQFEKLKEISEAKVQTIITTHWYGFMPIISQGTAIYCTKTENDPVLIDLRCFREEIKKLKAASRGQLPVELELKGINDLVQSIVASVTAASYSWLVCEGSADKIYLDHYLGDTKIIIVPVGGATTVKKIYNYVTLALEDSRDCVLGKAYFILDTDKQFESFEAKEPIDRIKIRRLQNDELDLDTLLLKTSDTNSFPPTVIEDTLNPEIWIKTLKSFNSEIPFSDYISKLETDFSIKDKSWPAALALDLKPSDRRIIEELFNEPTFKVKFALKYISFDTDKRAPTWTTEVRTHLLPRPVRRKRQKA